MIFKIAPHISFPYFGYILTFVMMIFQVIPFFLYLGFELSIVLVKMLDSLYNSSKKHNTILSCNHILCILLYWLYNLSLLNGSWISASVYRKIVISGTETTTRPLLWSCMVPRRTVWYQLAKLRSYLSELNVVPKDLPRFVRGSVSILYRARFCRFKVPITRLRNGPERLLCLLTIQPAVRCGYRVRPRILFKMSRISVVCFIAELAAIQFHRLDLLEKPKIYIFLTGIRL